MCRRMLEKDRLNNLTETIINAAIAVHRELGPGLLESAYEACLSYELMERRLFFERQKPLPLVYRSVRMDCGFRVDLLVEKSVIVEAKAIERIDRIHLAQVRSYLRLSSCKVGLLMNFNVKHLTADGL